MKPYSNILIEECHEPLVAIPLDWFAVETPHPYQKLGADYGGRSPYYLRQSVLDSLVQAQEYLQQIKPYWSLKIFDGFRPIGVQQFMVEYTFNQLAAKRSLQVEQLSPEQRENLLAQVYQIWAIPSANPLTPPPHSTGAAVDLTLVDGDGNEVDMGGAIDELGARSHPDYYSHSSESKAQQYDQWRQLLNRVMSQAGFVRHPGEWWHFSLGDQMWAWQQNQKYNCSRYLACYGKC